MNKEKSQISKKSIFFLSLLYFFVLQPIALFAIFMFTVKFSFIRELATPATNIAAFLSGVYIIYYFLDKITPRIKKLWGWVFAIFMILLVIYMPLAGSEIPAVYFKHKLINTPVNDFEKTTASIDKKRKSGRGTIYWYTFKIEGKLYRGKFLWDGQGRFNQRATVYYLPSNPNLSIEKEFYDRNNS